jgi:hypothetical protein
MNRGKVDGERKWKGQNDGMMEKEEILYAAF